MIPGQKNAEEMVADNYVTGGTATDHKGIAGYLQVSF